VKLFPLSRMS